MMNSSNRHFNRRNFLKTIGAAGLGSVLASSKLNADPNDPNKTCDANTTDPNAAAQQKPENPQVPRRKLGKTGITVPVLSLGTIFNVIDNQVILRKTLQWGVNYWDTADCYMGGNSELGIGKFLTDNKKIERKDVFIVTKADNKSTEGLQNHLNTSLERMNTDYVDVQFLHAVNNPDQINDIAKEHSLKAKEEKKIRFFGFSTHDNIPQCLTAASKTDFIDMIMFTYNFREMPKPEMNDAVQACYEAGIGLIAMKVQSHGIETDKDKELAAHFVKQGFTEGQAKIKAVLQDKRISSACIGRDSIPHLMLNIAAVLDKTDLTAQDMQVFKNYAQNNCSGYCAGCSEICTNALPEMPYTRDIMRYLMYHNSYENQQQHAKELFSSIPQNIRANLLNFDYRQAEARCPQKLPIAKFIKEAVTKLA